MSKHRGVRYRKTWWQYRTELKHKWHGLKRDVAYDWKHFWLDVADWREKNGR